MGQKCLVFGPYDWAFLMCSSVRGRNLMISFSKDSECLANYAELLRYLFHLFLARVEEDFHSFSKFGTSERESSSLLFERFGRPSACLREIL